MGRATEAAGGGAGGDPAAFDRLRRRVLWSLPTGLFVVGSRAGAERNLMTANWVMQVATAPKLVAVAVESGSVTRRLIADGGGFSVSVLPRSERGVVRKFVKPVDAGALVVDDDGVVVSVREVPVHEVTGGLPCLRSARAWLACEVRRRVDWEGAHGTTPSHVLFVGEVVDAGEDSSGPGAGGGQDGDDTDGGGVLRMEDTRMNYGG